MEFDTSLQQQNNVISSNDTQEKNKKSVEMSKFKHYYNRFRNNPKVILVCLCAAGVVQGMIFTNVVISTIERRFGLDSTQSGFVAGSYDLGSLIAIIPITYFGGRPTASKPRYISAGMLMIALGSITFLLPHFTTESYLQSLTNSMDLQESKSNTSSSSEGKLCRNQILTSEESHFSSFDMHHPYAPTESEPNIWKSNISSNMPNQYIADGNADESAMSLSSYRYVFVLAQFFHGIGASALISLGVTYLDESVNKKDAPLFIGIFEASFVLGPAIGYVVGGKLLSLFTEFYLLDDLESLKNFSNTTISIIEELSPTSPQWIGAWWLGFMMIVVLALVMAFILSLFPAQLHLTNEEEIGTVSNVSEKQNSSQVEADGDVLHVNRCDYGKVKDMPKVIFQLLTNTTYVAMSFGATMDAFLLAGMAAFLPKYLESQFDLSPGDAAITVGIIVVPGGAGGTLLGGYLMKRLGLDRTGAIKMYLICQAAILPLYFGFMYHCPTGMYNGVNYNINENGAKAATNFMQENRFNSMCKTNCSCSAFVKNEGASLIAYSATYEPVCSLLDKVTYYSACHAGCQFEDTYENQTAYYGCSCLQHPQPLQTGRFELKNSIELIKPMLNEERVKNDSEDLKRKLGIVLNGECERDSCSSIPLAVIIFFQILFTFMATMPGLVASLRSVEPIQRSLALGLQTLLIRGLGTVPGPITFGYLIDITCLLWHNTVVDEAKVILNSGQNLDAASNSVENNASCRVYDNTTMSRNVMFVSLGWKTMASLFMATALYFSKKSDRKKNERESVECIKNDGDKRNGNKDAEVAV